MMKRPSAYFKRILIVIIFFCACACACAQATAQRNDDQVAHEVEQLIEQEAFDELDGVKLI